MSSHNMPVQLTKSLFLKGKQCSKSLWLQTNKSEVLTKESKSNILETGQSIGKKARELFPGGKEISLHGTTQDQRIELTQQWISEGVKTVYEATFEFDGVLVMVDVLHRNESGYYEIYEVKSSTWNSKKKLKDISEYIDDVSVQYYVLSGCKIELSNIFVTLINSDYVRGETLDLNGLFIHQDITLEVAALQSSVASRIASLKETLSKGVEPNIDIGWHCKNPRQCDGFEYCWHTQRQIPEYSVFDLFKLTKNAKSLSLYQQGVVDIKDIPESFKLTETQRFIVDSVKYGEEGKAEINHPQLQEFIQQINYPIYHIDFETFQQPIPKFQGIKPFQQIPFQYSLHVEHKDGSLEHREFLADAEQDPRELFVQQLVSDIPCSATTVAFNSSFEKMILKDLSNQFPQYTEHLLAIMDNMIDLAIPFQKRYYYLPEMRGQHSIKIVLPLLAPEMENSYKDLDLIHNGSEAMQTFAELGDIKDADDIKRYRNALLEYCKLDTLAMVKILNILKKSLRNQ